MNMKFAGMKSSDPVKFLTSVREPIRHFLSVYNIPYFLSNEFACHATLNICLGLPE